MAISIKEIADAMQIGLRLHRAGRPGLMDKPDGIRLAQLNNAGKFSIYHNSRGITHVGSNEGHHIKILKDNTIEVD